jgi:hypothetical protein
MGGNTFLAGEIISSDKQFASGSRREHGSIEAFEPHEAFMHASLGKLQQSRERYGPIRSAGHPPCLEYRYQSEGFARVASVISQMCLCESKGG